MGEISDIKLVLSECINRINALESNGFVKTREHCSWHKNTKEGNYCVELLKHKCVKFDTAEETDAFCEALNGLIEDAISESSGMRIGRRRK